ncbi:annexin [Kipferlia bialata]|uniref:Annexin n=2 Tax=Kipferlia bialata TaxID=797122 RepID=A0A9K3CXD7_9EUKA|nr:annexin [Kipferlia bialata]|eukprot:g6699.t1
MAPKSGRKPSKGKAAAAAPPAVSSGLIQTDVELVVDESPVESVAVQHKAIRAAYEARFARDLIDHIKGDTTGKYQDLLVACVEQRQKQDAKYIRKACKGAGTDNQMMMDIVLARNAAELKAIAAAYEHLYHRDMKEDILNDMDGKLKRVFIAALSMGREFGPADPSRLESDVEELHDAFKGLGTDETKVFQILFSRSMMHLRQVFVMYEQTYGKTVRDTLKKEFTGKIEDCVVAVCDWCTDPAKAAAVILHRAIKGLGSDEDRLEAALATRYDICGFGRIAAAYDAKYGPGKCAKDIKGDLTGTREKLALALLHIE